MNSSFNKGNLDGRIESPFYLLGFLGLVFLAIAIIPLFTKMFRGKGTHPEFAGNLPS